MRRTDLRLGAILALALGQQVFAQVVSPPELRDRNLRPLQQKYLLVLKAVGQSIASHPFPYPFYFSRTLDLNEDQQKTRDQRSIQFARYQNLTVVQITGNYYAAYSADLMKKEERARQAFVDVILPMVQVAVTHLQKEDSVEGFAFEISYHVRKKMLGVSAEHAENLVVVLPKTAAVHIISDPNEDGQKAAVREGSVFIDGQPATLWPGEEPISAENVTSKPAPVSVAGLDTNPPASSGSALPSAQALAAKAVPITPSVLPSTRAAVPLAPAKDTPREITPEILKSLQTSYQETLDRMLRELDKTAHFVTYAPPLFVTFHHGAYLQISIKTPLPVGAAESRYHAAALAFDEHIAHLIRPVLSYFETPDFEGIDFGTTIEPAGKKPEASGSSLAIEYIFSIQNLRCYAEYDCTGQQLISSSFVLINGERVSLDLQNAESIVGK